MRFAVKESEKVLLGKAQQIWNSGLSVLRKERAFTEMSNVMAMVDGDQVPVRSKALSQLTDNRIRKIMLDMVSAFTDVRPIWDYQTFNAEFKEQGTILSKLARAWWKNAYVDRRLQGILSYAFTGGSGYGLLQWNPYLPGGGDIELTPIDPRDVAPITPSYSSDSIQDWEGVMVRERVSIEELKQRYPHKAYVIGKTKSWGGQADKTHRRGEIFTPAWEMLFKSPSAPSLTDDDGNCDLYRIYIKDYTLNTGDKPVKMGKPGTSWEYEVFPFGSTYPPGHKLEGKTVTSEEARLYPRGRVILCTPDALLEDVPNPYWHGQFPLIRFTFVPTPWSILGASVGADLVSLQNGLNEGLRGLEDGIGQWVRRGIIADKNAIPKHELEAIDPRRSGMKMRINATMGEGVKIVEGPMFPPWMLETLRYYKDEMDELSGVRGLQQLAQLKQMPSADTMEKFMDAMSPLLKVMARSIEVSLSEVAYQFMVNVFQYYDLSRRVQVLGPDGVSLEDFDYDPLNLVPATKEGMPDYKPEYDADKTTRLERAQLHHRNFTFNVAPNSFLNVSHMGHKMMVLQGTRMNLVDPWTFWEALDFSNVGPPPAQTIPERLVAARKMGLMPGPTPEMVAMQQQMMAMQMQMQMAMMQGGGGPPGAGGPPGGGGGMLPPGMPPPPVSGVGSQGGRPPSGQQPPQFVQKGGPGGPRVVTSESGR